MQQIRTTLMVLAALFHGIVQAQQPLQTSSKVVIDDGYDYTELSVTPWGGSHGIFFGSKQQYSGMGDLWHPGNTVYANNAGQYSYGAFSIGYIANGGLFGFYDGGLSTGAGNPISWQAVMTFHRGGNIGIGMGQSNPSEKLELHGNQYVVGENRGIIVDVSGNKRVGFMKYPGRVGGIWRAASQEFEIGRTNVQSLASTPTSFVTDFYIDGNGSVGIGTRMVSADYKLFVEKGIRTRKVQVDQSNWPDYVFASSYKLPSLQEVEAFIKQHKHLPDVPSAGEVEKNGLDLGENQAVLLRKIEELTLYMIEQHKKQELLQKQVQELENSNQILKAEMERLKQCSQ